MNTTAVIMGCLTGITDIVVIFDEFGIIIDGEFEGKRARDIVRDYYREFCCKINPALDDKNADDMEILDDNDSYNYRNKFVQIMFVPRVIGLP